MKKVVFLSVLALMLVLSACSGGNNNQQGNGQNDGNDGNDGGSKETVTIELAAGADGSKQRDAAIERFNETHTDIQIKYVELPSVPNEQLTRYSTWFNSHSETPDLFLMDVTWPKMFASAGWIAPLDEYLDDDFKERFWPAALEVAQMDGKQYGVQSYMDVGALYYRTDLLEKYGHEVPTTWTELEEISKDIIAQENNPNLVGYVFQGAKIEGATLNWLEFFWGNGGEVMDEEGNIRVDSPEGIEAMRTMQGLVHESGISPVSVATSNPNDNKIVFGNGNAIFMRNWPSFYEVMKDEVVKGNYDVAPLPHHEGFEDHSSTGGWVYGINSNSEHKEEAAEVMKWFLSNEEQKDMAINGGVIPSVKAVVEDPAVIEAQPVFEKLTAILENAKSRPALRAYEQFSRALQTEVNLAMNNLKDAEQAMKDAQKEIDKIEQ
ncbi:ABC transporter substrate-binding protein [Marinicrinis sediminis]|uniref:ABC transporter substrate-binding protein n=1 Tax=Marinicrinis sediminis TaxID=1652465 RepID=A0ABW5RBX6_9BACL